MNDDEREEVRDLIRKLREEFGAEDGEWVDDSVRRLEFACRVEEEMNSRLPDPFLFEPVPFILVQDATTVDEVMEQIEKTSSTE